MKVRIQGKQLRVSEALKRYVLKRVARPLERFYDDPAAELRVEIGDNNGPKGGCDKECHLTLRIPGVSTVQIEEVTQDAYASIDVAAERLMRACKRELGRLRTSRVHGTSRRRPMPVLRGAARRASLEPEGRGE
jgi:putative sigma-54 modulation protein